MAFGTDTVVSRKLKKAQEKQSMEHQELMDAINSTNQWLGHIAAILERQAPMQGGVYHQAGAPK